MKKYILFSKNDLERLANGEELRHTLHNGELVYLMLDEAYARENEINETDWMVAYDHLNMVMAEYLTLGKVGAIVLQEVLTPLKCRYDMGERTRSLYNNIMLYD